MARQGSSRPANPLCCRESGCSDGNLDINPWPSSAVLGGSALTVLRASRRHAPSARPKRQRRCARQRDALLKRELGAGGGAERDRGALHARPSKASRKARAICSARSPNGWRRSTSGSARTSRTPPPRRRRRWAACRRGLSVIDEAQKNLTDLSGQVVGLQQILSNKQTRGAFGQGQMEAIVRDALPAGRLRVPGDALQQQPARLPHPPARQQDRASSSIRNFRWKRSSC